MFFVPLSDQTTNPIYAKSYKQRQSQAEATTGWSDTMNDPAKPNELMNEFIILTY